MQKIEKKVTIELDSTEHGPIVYLIWVIKEKGNVELWAIGTNAGIALRYKRQALAAHRERYPPENVIVDIEPRELDHSYAGADLLNLQGLGKLITEKGKRRMQAFLNEEQVRRGIS